MPTCCGYSPVPPPSPAFAACYAAAWKWFCANCKGDPKGARAAYLALLALCHSGSAGRKIVKALKAKPCDCKKTKEKPRGK